MAAGGPGPGGRMAVDDAYWSQSAATLLEALASTAPADAGPGRVNTLEPGHVAPLPTGAGG